MVHLLVVDSTGQQEPEVVLEGGLSVVHEQCRGTGDHCRHIQSLGGWRGEGGGGCVTVRRRKVNGYTLSPGAEAMQWFPSTVKQSHTSL